MANSLHCDSVVFDSFSRTDFVCIWKAENGGMQHCAGSCTVWKGAGGRSYCTLLNKGGFICAATMNAPGGQFECSELCLTGTVQAFLLDSLHQACLQLTTITVEQCWHQQHGKREAFSERTCLSLEAHCNLWFPVFIVHEDFVWKEQSLIRAWSNHRCSLCILLQFTKRDLKLQLVFVFVIGVSMEQRAV